MKRIYNILLAFMAFASVSCVENKIETDIPAAGSGDEVQFGLTLPGLTRTVYGQEANGAFPIYWVNGDKVQIISPDCLAGRNDAEYKVSVNNAEQNFVTSLTPTGANGVQWGNKAAAFYSVYPSGDYTIADGGNTIQNLKINFSDDFEVDANGVITPRQADCLMFAKTGEIKIGSPVNLTYSPIATAVMLTLNGPTVDTDPTILGRSTKIQSVKLIAPEGTAIAGNFNVTLKTEGANEGKYVFTEWVKGAQTSNEITAQIFDKATGEFYDIPAGKSVTLSMFLAPIDGLEIKANSDNAKDNWRIEVLVQSEITKSPEKEGDANVVTEAQKLFTKSLKFTESSTTVLKPGMVHKLPALPKLDVDSNSGWNVQDWMVHVPRNVYLSEVSIPGTWNSMNSDSQTNTSLKDQYDKGARAFHIDTRWKRINEGTSWQPSYKYELGVAIGGSYNTTSGDNKYMTAGPTFVEALSTITQNVKSDEYMVLMCTFAQNSAEYNGADGWINAISTACANNDLVYDAKNLTSNTLVGDVLNKVLVIINMEGEFASIPSGSKCLFINAPMTIANADEFKTNLSTSIYKGADNVTKPTESGISIYNSHAQISVQGDGSSAGNDNRQDDMRGYIPSYNERRDIALEILEWSKNNYMQENYDHNKWIYLGFGGYYVEWKRGGLFDTEVKWRDIDDAYEVLATDFNKLINSEIDKMGTIPTGETQKIPYYPVGIILLNNGVDNEETLKKILLLNNKYRMQFNPDFPTNYNPNAKAISAAPSYSSGMNDSDVAAFGWD